MEQTQQTPTAPDPILALISLDNADNASQGNRRKRAFGYKASFWPTGSKLRIAFVDDASLNYSSAFIDAINEWAPHVNLTFEFIDGRQGQPGYGKGDIRIATMLGHSYSVVGSNARDVMPNEPTMVIGHYPPNPLFRVAVLHEFGHALGARHEHQHPDADIPWDAQAVYYYYSLRGLNTALADENVLNKTPASYDLLTTPYDPKSIMHYPVTNNETVGDWEVPRNMDLSDGDKAFMALAYPH